MPSLFSQELHPVNIPDHCTEMVAFIITACHKLRFSSLFWQGLMRALGTPLSVMRNPRSSLCDLIWCHATQEKLSVARCTSCFGCLGFPYDFNPGLPNTLQSMGKYFPTKRLKSRGNHDIPLCHTLVYSFWYCWLSLQGSCVSSLVILSTDSLLLWLCQWEQIYHVLREFLLSVLHCFLETWTKLTKLLFVHRVHPCPWLSDTEEGSEIYSLPEVTEHGTVQNWSRSPINGATCLCSS